MKLDPVEAPTADQSAFYAGYSQGLQAAATEFRADLNRAERDAYEQGLVEGRDRLERWKDRVEAARPLVDRWRREGRSVTVTDGEGAVLRRAADLLEAALEAPGPLQGVRREGNA